MVATRSARAAAGLTGLQGMEQILKCAHRFAYNLVKYVGIKDVGGLLVVRPSTRPTAIERCSPSATTPTARPTTASPSA